MPRHTALWACALLAGCASTPPAATTARFPAPVVTLDSSLTRPPVAPPPARPVQALIDSVVSLPQFANMHWGVLIVDPVRGDTLASHNADRLLTPASNMKLVSSAVALTQLGADYRWRTVFTRTGQITAGVLHGDLVVEGRGDPSVSIAMRGPDPLIAFDALVLALKAAGIRRIDGRVRASDIRAFPGSPLGFGWEWDDLAEDYGSGVSELLFNEGFTRVHVAGCARAGRRACVTTSPARTSPIIRSSVTVRSAASGPPTLTWWRDSAATPGITIQGSIAAGDSTMFTASQSDVRETYVAAVTEALTRAGITVRSGATRGTASDTVFVMQSAPLPDVLRALQKPSQNQLAEVLFRTLGLERTGSGTPDSGRVVVERQLRSWGARDDAFAIRDGSGLSRHDFITPRTIITVLDAMRRAPTFAVYRDALPIGGVDGSLRNRLQGAARGRVWAKTGSFDKARSLSGYIATESGDTLLFSMLANNFSVSSREVDRIADLVVERLVTLRKPTP